MFYSNMTEVKKSIENPNHLENIEDMKTTMNLYIIKIVVSYCALLIFLEKF